MKTTLPVALLLFVAPCAIAQYAPPDPAGLQGIIVETYYVADANDAADLDGSIELIEGATTYRVFVDLLPDYKLLTVGGFTDHPITFNTSTTFYNNDDRGEAWGSDIPANHLNKNTVAIDSWLTMGVASTMHLGIPKADDTDGSVVGGANNNGGSNNVPGGLLVNQTSAMGPALTQADGLLQIASTPNVVAVGTPPDLFEPGGGNSYSNDNFAWAVLGGWESPETDNKILIGQFTTNGTFTFCLNLWVRIPDPLVCDDPNCHEILEFYGTLLPSDTAGTAFNTHNKFTHPTLCFNSSQFTVDCEGVQNGPAQPGTPCDDGIAGTTNDIYLENCTCAGEDCEGTSGGPALPGTPCENNGVWTAGCICEGVVSVHENDELRSLVHVYPNPVNNLLMIELGLTTPEDVIMELKDATGRTLDTRDLGLIPAEWRGSLDMSAYASGIYFVEFIVGRERITERIIK